MEQICGRPADGHQRGGGLRRDGESCERVSRPTVAPGESFGGEAQRRQSKRRDSLSHHTSAAAASATRPLLPIGSKCTVWRNTIPQL